MFKPPQEDLPGEPAEPGEYRLASPVRTRIEDFPRQSPEPRCRGNILPPGHRLEIGTALIPRHDSESTAVRSRVYRNRLLHRQSGIGGGFVVGGENRPGYLTPRRLPVVLLRVAARKCQLHRFPKLSFP